MPPLILLSLMLFTTLSRLAIELGRAARRRLPAESGEAGALAEFGRERIEWSHHFDRRLKFARIIAGAAPLLGLLGTVAGMLKTFTALGLKQGVDSIDLVASGISEALITTETGLSIAIVGLVAIWALKGIRRRVAERFERHESAIVLSRYEQGLPC